MRQAQGVADFIKTLTGTFADNIRAMDDEERQKLNPDRDTEPHGNPYVETTPHLN